MDKVERLRAVAARVGGIALVAVVGGVVAACGTDQSTPDPVATDPTPSTAPAAGPAPVAEAWSDAEPPRLVLGTRDAPVAALQQSYCWGNGCFDMTRPSPSAIPTIAGAPLQAAFPRPGAWDFTVFPDLAGHDCSRPVLVEADDAGTTLTLTPTGPGGTVYGDYFFRPDDGGDTSGTWRWEVPPADGVALSWVSLVQNGPSSGGEARLGLVVDDAALPGKVSATVTVTSADGRRTRLPLPEVDRGCGDDRLVRLQTPTSERQQAIDGLGAAPYDYRVELSAGASTYVGTGTWSGRGTLHGGDARVTFDPPLPG